MARRCLAGDNFSQDLKDRGLPNASLIDRIYDFNFSQGGPIKKDKLWFFTTLRAWSVNAPIAGTFVTDGTGPAIAPAWRRRRPRRPCDQGIDDQRIRSGLVRLTYQVSPRNKLAAYFDEIDKFRGHAMFAGDDYNTAAVVWNSPAYHTGVGQVDVDGQQPPAARRPATRTTPRTTPTSRSPGVSKLARLGRPGTPARRAAISTSCRPRCSR